MKTVQEINKIISDFRELVNETKEIYNINSAIVNESDKAFGDIRHYCELQYPTKRTKKTLVCKLINEYSAKRREAKDINDVLEPLYQFIIATGNRNFCNDVGKIANNTANAFKKVQGERKYAPRVLEDLFVEE